MNIYKVVTISLLALISACSVTQPTDNKSQVQLADDEAIYWINSLRVDCVGVAPRSCLQVQQSESLNHQGWQLFYSSIDGFTYEAGHIYKLVIKKVHTPQDQLPADRASIKYSLVKILEKTVDSKLQLHDIWALEKIQGELISLGNGALGYRSQRPQLEIHLRDMKIIGHDGCNKFSGAISSLENNEITFGPVMGTRMFCQGMDVSNQFNSHIISVKSYVIKDLTLYLFDEQGGELLSFRKID